MNSKYANVMEVLINIFTVDKGVIKVLLFKKTDEPYKGHWMLPSSLLYSTETVFDCANDIMENMVGINDVDLKISSIYSDIDRVPDKRVIGSALFGVADNVKAYISRKNITDFESEWFDIDAIPKMVGDHGTIINDAVFNLFDEIKKKNILKALFPSDFTLPELQKVYEQVLNKDLDRRNFRKKILNLDIIEPTGEKNDCLTGRPAHLYRFKDTFNNTRLYEEVI